MAPLAAILPWVATGVGLLGTGASALAQIQAGKAGQAAMNANAQTSVDEANQRRLSAQEDSLKLSRAARQTMGEQIAGYGASGITEAGSPIEVMMNTAKNYERDMIMTGYGAEVGASQKMNEANMLEWAGKQKRKTGYLSAGTTLLSGAGQYGMSKLPLWKVN